MCIRDSGMHGKYGEYGMRSVVSISAMWIYRPMTTDVLEGGGRIEREIDLHKNEEISDDESYNRDNDDFSILPMPQLFEVFDLPNKLITQHDIQTMISKPKYSNIPTNF